MSLIYFFATSSTNKNYLHGSNIISMVLVLKIRGVLLFFISTIKCDIFELLANI